MKTSTAIGVLVVLVVAVVGAWMLVGNRSAETPLPTEDPNQPIAQVAFACNAGKSIGASFFIGTSTDPNQPSPGSVGLVLSDGRSMTLLQTVSASGIRYANQDESLVFWGKGNTAFVEEGATKEQTYTGCIVVAPDPTNTLTQVFASSTLGYTVRFPQNYQIDQKHVYQALGPGKGISGVKMTIPAALTEDTNLSKDSYVSVEELPRATSCTADQFLAKGAKVSTFSDAGVDYSVATSSGAAAGNRYDEAVFAIPGSSPCTAVRYWVHYGVIENYPAGTVQEFNRAALLGEFDAIRRSLVLGR